MDRSLSIVRPPLQTFFRLSRFQKYRHRSYRSIGFIEGLGSGDKGVCVTHSSALRVGLRLRKSIFYHEGHLLMRARSLKMLGRNQHSSQRKSRVAERVYKLKALVSVHEGI